MSIAILVSVGRVPGETFILDTAVVDIPSAIATRRVFLKVFPSVISFCSYLFISRIFLSATFDVHVLKRKWWSQKRWVTDKFLLLIGALAKSFLLSSIFLYQWCNTNIFNINSSTCPHFFCHLSFTRIPTLVILFMNSRKRWKLE